MNIGRLIKKHNELFIKDLASENLHHVENVTSELVRGEYYSYEINENDDAIDLIPAHAALKEYGIRADTGSFYNELNDEDPSADPIEAESFFGTCELTGMRGDVVPCLYLDTDGNVVRVEAGTWLVHSVLGKLAGAF